MADFILTKKRREWTAHGNFPKVSLNRDVYEQLHKVALEADMSMAAVACKAIQHALSELKWVEETD